MFDCASSLKLHIAHFSFQKVMQVLLRWHFRQHQVPLPQVHLVHLPWVTHLLVDILLLWHLQALQDLQWEAVGMEEGMALLLECLLEWNMLLVRHLLEALLWRNTDIVRTERWGVCELWIRQVFANYITGWVFDMEQLGNKQHKMHTVMACRCGLAVRERYFCTAQQLRLLQLAIMLCKRRHGVSATLELRVLKFRYRAVAGFQPIRGQQFT